MKICLISFDFFDLDYHIVLELKRRNIDANHIDISKFQYRYATFFDRISNFFCKLFLNKNKKKIKTEEYILEQLREIGYQDFILVIRLDRISKKAHLQIKKYTNKYISYVYDSCKRFPIDHLLNGIFDKVFSFDLYDCKKYGFTFVTNYIYLEKRELKDKNEIKNTAFIILSIDERFGFLNKLANYLTDNNIDFKFIIVGKKIPENSNPNIIFTKKPLYLKDIREELEYSKIFIDLIRHDHSGLSFRIFEALSMQRKIITTNKSIVNYDFYNPNNILVIDENSISIDSHFLNTPYMPLEDSIYEKYTLSYWVKIVFDLQKKYH
jgi:hypothetical protein